jgi:hypothetical protein
MFSSFIKKCSVAPTSVICSKIAYSFWLAEHHFVMDKLIYIPVLLVRWTDLSGSYFHIYICIYI